MEWKPVEVSITNEKKLVETIRLCGHHDGVVIIKDIYYGPLMNNVRKMFDKLGRKSESIEKINSLIPNMVFKDATNLQCNHKIDQKKTVDLSPNRISIINQYDSSLLQTIGLELSANLHFLTKVATSLSPVILNAINIGDINDSNSVNYNFRMIDYYSASNKNQAKQERCGEHRDFGLFTLIFADDVGGLQIQRNNKWIDIKADENCAILLFGWCAEIITNGRITATKHRVVQNEKRRNAAVLFVAPSEEQVLLPIVKENERRNFMAIKTKTLKERMRNAWKMREGTLSEKEVDLFENKLKSQSDILDTIKL